MSVEGRTDLPIVETSSKAERRKLPPVDHVVTARGSIYRYLPDGRTQRFKAAEGKEYPPQDALVFVPDFEWVSKNAPPEMRKHFGENAVQFEQELLGYAQRKGKKNYIVDGTGKKLDTSEAILNTEGLIYLTFGDENGKVDFFIPVTIEPKIGYYTFDTRKYKEGDEWKRESHFGNNVVKIVEKNKK